MVHITGFVNIERRRFVRHFLEMVAAMIGGMVVFGGLVKLFCALTGHEGLLDHPGASAPIMATNMTVGMSLWMWHRCHGPAAIGEMAGAMYVPLVVLVVPFWVGVLPGGALLGGTHVLMLPAMWLAMLHRRDEYVHDHHSVASTRPLAHVQEEVTEDVAARRCSHHRRGRVLRPVRLGDQHRGPTLARPSELGSRSLTSRSPHKTGLG